MGKNDRSAYELLQQKSRKLAVAYRSDAFYEKLGELRGLYINRPERIGGSWVFGGGIPRRIPDVVIEVGSLWQWTCYDERVFDSEGLSQMSVSMMLLSYESDDFKITGHGLEKGRFFSLTTTTCGLVVAPENRFQLAGPPPRVRLWLCGELIYEDWNDDDLRKLLRAPPIIGNAHNGLCKRNLAQNIHCPSISVGSGYRW